MRIINFRNMTLLLVMLLPLLAGCGKESPETSPTPEPETVLTAAAQTAEFRLTELAKSTLTPTPAPTFTPTISSATSEPVTSTPAGIPTLTATVQDLPSGSDKAEFVMDVTVPDGTEFNPGESFTKIWQLSNVGSSTWSTSYRLAFIGGSQMGEVTEVSLPNSVPPGSTVDVEVELVAPDTSGTHRGFWSMKNSAGTLFDNAVYVEIKVIGGSEAEEPTAAPPGEAVVTDVSIRVEEGYANECPYEFLFTGTFKLNKPASVTYQLEAGSSTPGFVFDLPAPVSGNFDAGTHVVTFNLNLDNSVDGWMQLHISAPNEEYSNQESFVLECGE